MEIDENEVDVFVRWFESLLILSLDPFRNLLKGHHECLEIGKAAREAASQTLLLAHRLKKDDEIDISPMIKNISTHLLLESNLALERMFFIASPSCVYMPDIFIYAHEVEDKLLFTFNKSRKYAQK